MQYQAFCFQRHILTLYLIETHFNTIANSTDQDQGLLCLRIEICLDSGHHNQFLSSMYKRERYSQWVELSMNIHELKG